MLNDLPAGQQVYLVTGYTDLRRSIDGLAMIVQSQLQLDPFSTALFLFCGRRRDRIKGLLWEGDGFLLLYKRLDNGQFQWPRNETEARLLTPQQTRWLLEGLMIEQPKAIREENQAHYTKEKQGKSTIFLAFSRALWCNRSIKKTSEGVRNV